MKVGHFYGIQYALRHGLAWYWDDVLRVPLGGDGWREVPQERLMTSIVDPVTHESRDVCVLVNGEPTGARALEILDSWDRDQLAFVRSTWTNPWS